MTAKKIKKKELSVTGQEQCLLLPKSPPLIINKTQQYNLKIMLCYLKTQCPLVGEG